MIEELKKYVYEHNLHEKAVEYFWVAFKNWKKENPKEYSKKFKNISPDSIEVIVHTIGLRASQWPECDYSHITITIHICYKKGSFSKYTVWFSLDGDPVADDDFLEII